MAFIDDIVKFHSFSKSTVRTGLTLGEAVNPSGHTVTSKQVRTDDIPWFVNSFQGDEAKARTWAANNAKDARHNDILYYGAEFKVGFTAPKCLIYVSKHKVDGKLVDLPAEQCGWQTFDLNAATTLKNADGKDVIAIHKNAKVEYVDGNNNAATNSNQQSLFVRRADGTLLDHFVAATDQIVGGQPSLGYSAVVSVGGKAIDEGEGTGNYIGNTYAGIVHFHAARTEGKETDGSVKNITVTCFEYIGDKLDTTLTDIDAKISKIVGDAFEGAVASVTADTNTKNLGLTVTDGANPVITVTPGTISDTKLVTGSTVKTYVDTTALAEGGSIAQKIESAINDLGDVAVKGDIKISEIKVKSGSTTTTLTPDSNKSVTVEIPEVQAATTSVAGVVTISDNDAIATTETSTAAATVAAVAATRSTIASELGALAVTVNSNKTEVDGKISAIEGKLASTGEIGQAIAGVKATADSAVQSVTRATGSSDLITVTDGTDVTISLSTEVATKTDITTEINKLSATGGAITALDGRVDAIETSLAEGGETAEAIAAAKKAGTDAQAAADAKVADVTVDGTSVVTGATGSKTVALTTTKTDAITASADSTSTALATEASVAKALASITSVGVSYQVLADGQTHTSITAPVNGRIYLEKDTTNAEAGVYIEWMYTNESGWEKIGSTKTDHSTYASTITVNGSTKTVGNSAVDLGAFASSVTAGNGVASGSVSTTGALSLTLTTASTTTAGISQLTDTYTSTDATKAATGKAIAAAIATLDATNVGEGAVKVSQTDGKVTSVTVATEALVTDGAIKASVTDANALVKAGDALEAIKLAKPENYVASVTGYTTAGEEVTTTQGAALTIKDGRETIYEADLWGTTVDIKDGVITVNGGLIDASHWADVYSFDKKISLDSTDDSGNTYIVDNNKLSDNNGNILANIKTDELINGQCMFMGAALTSFNGDLSSLINGTSMFHSTALTSFDSDLSSLVSGYCMFASTALTSFNRDLSSLINGNHMFCNASITSFDGDLSSLVDGKYMFASTALTSFTSDLSSLVDGNYMFSTTNALTSFTGDLSSLVSGKYMFEGSNITSFNGDLSSLVNAYEMFRFVPLTSFTSDLSSLVSGHGMFTNVALDVESTEIICYSLPEKSKLQSWNKNNGIYEPYTDGEFTFKYKTANFNYPSSTNITNATSGVKLSIISETIPASRVCSIYIKYSSEGLATLTDNDKATITALFEETAQRKGWTIITNAELGGTHTPTVAMSDGTVQRYIYAIKNEADEKTAKYVDTNGKYWTVDTAEAIIGPNVKYWELFATKEDAIATWGLSKYTYVEPTEEA